MRFIGDSSNAREIGGNTGTYRGEPVRFVVSTDHVIYHNLSVSREFDKGLNAIFGVANALDEKPPRVTTLATGAGLSTVGNSAFYSQYDWYGRRFFINVNKSL
jgi:iron complex outermembrane recepter protein